MTESPQVGRPSANRLLDRLLSREQVAHVTEVGAPALSLTIDESLRAFERCLTTAKGGEHHWGILLPLHQLCEMADGAEVLLQQSCVVAAAPLLRGMLEANVGIRWILSEDTERRALAYVVADMRRALAYFRRMDAESATGRQLRAELAAGSESVAELPPENLRAKASAILEELSREPLRSVNDAFTAATHSSTKVRAWYEGAGGPASVREACQAVGRLSDYEVMYRTWSSTGHSQDVDRIVASSSTVGATSISILRSPQNVALAYTFAIAFLLDAVKRVIDYYRPGEGPTWARFYSQELQSPMNELERLQELSRTAAP